MAALREMESETGIDLRDDIASSLGTDFVIALEGISMMQPAWVTVLEVLNPGALDEAVRRMVNTFNMHAPADQELLLSFTEESVNGRTWKMLADVPSGGGIHSSGFFWLDLGAFAEVMTAMGQETSGLGNGTEPILVVITGDTNWIRWASRARLTSLIFDILLI